QREPDGHGGARQPADRRDAARQRELRRRGGDDARRDAALARSPPARLPYPAWHRYAVRADSSLPAAGWPRERQLGRAARRGPAAANLTEPEFTARLGASQPHATHRRTA